MTHIPSLARTLLGLLFITCFIFFLRYPNLTNSDILFTSNYETMARRSYIKDFKIIKNKKPLFDVIKFFRSKNIEAVYGDFLFIYKANFLGDNSPFFIEYLTKPKYYTSEYFQTKVEQSRSLSNFAVITHSDSTKNIYLQYLNQFDGQAL